jgi:maltooligosyltrehalose trehalohydrolase
MKLMPLGSLGAVETNGTVTFGLWLPWSRLSTAMP